MIKIILVSFFIVTILVHKSYAQEIPKDTIYLDFNNYKDNFKHKDIIKLLKWKKKEGIQFNLCGKAVFIFPNTHKSDTLCNKHLKDYKITQMKQIDSLGSAWYRKNLEALTKKYGEIIAPHDNNGKFVTYIIEKHKKYFVKYRVYWRNQGI